LCYVSTAPTHFLGLSGDDKKADGDKREAAALALLSKQHEEEQRFNEAEVKALKQRLTEEKKQKAVAERQKERPGFGPGFGALPPAAAPVEAPPSAVSASSGSSSTSSSSSSAPALPPAPAPALSPAPASNGGTHHSPARSERGRKRKPSARSIAADSKPSSSNAAKTAEDAAAAGTDKSSPSKPDTAASASAAAESTPSKVYKPKRPFRCANCSSTFATEAKCKEHLDSGKCAQRPSKRPRKAKDKDATSLS
jgi:hypothetical protein